MQKGLLYLLIGKFIVSEKEKDNEDGEVEEEAKRAAVDWFDESKRAAVDWFDDSKRAAVDWFLQSKREGARRGTSNGRTRSCKCIHTPTNSSAPPTPSDEDKSKQPLIEKRSAVDWFMSSKRGCRCRNSRPLLENKRSAVDWWLSSK